MSDAIDSEGEIVGRGRFRVDRKLALEKMERFQLEDPFRYVLELFAAAITAGTEAVEITNDSDDFVIEWTGALPTRDELDGLFDHLFHRGDGARSAMLQHLAIAVLGALGLEPKWTRIERATVGPGDPGLYLEVDDPAQTRCVERESSIAGMRCHVRERLGQATMADALALLFGNLPTEARLVQGAALWSPVPVRINGRPMPLGRLPPIWLDEIRVEEDGRAGHLWLLPVAARGSVDIVRHGIVVGHCQKEVAGETRIRRAFPVAGWIRDDRLDLNASRSGVVADEKWAVCDAALDRAVDDLVRSAVQYGFEADREEVVRWTGGDGTPHRATVGELTRLLGTLALERLVQRSSDLGALAELPLLTDLSGRTWTPSDLKALPAGQAPAWTKNADLFHAAFARPLFGPDLATLIAGLVPGATDATEELSQRRKGEQRRASAAARRADPWFGVPGERKFERGMLRGSVRLIGFDGTPGIVVQVRIGGLPVQTHYAKALAGRLEAILDDPSFEADLAFEAVNPNQLATALARLRDEALALLVDRVRDGPPHEALPLLTDLVRRLAASGRPGKAFATRTRNSLPPAACDVSVFPCGDGATKSLREVLDAPEPFTIVESLPPHCPDDIAARVLVLPAEVRAHWVRWLGDLAADGTETLAADVERARRLAAGRREARLPAHVELRVSVELETARGELGLSVVRRASNLFLAQRSQLELLRDGVEVCTCAVVLPLPGVVGCIDVPNLGVTRAHDALAEDGDLAGIVEMLLPAVDRLALALWDELGAEVTPERPIRDVLLAWLAVRPMPDEAKDRPVCANAGGDTWSWTQLQEHARTGKKAKKLVLLPRLPPLGMGLDDAIVAGPHLGVVLELWLEGRTRDGREQLEELEARLAAYEDRPRLGDLPDAVASAPIAGAGWEGTAFIPRDPGAAGRITTEVAWRGRLLVLVRSKRLGAAARVHGPGLLPDSTFNAVRDTKAAKAIVDACAKVFPDLLEQVLSGDVLPESDPSRPALLLALRARMPERAAGRLASLAERLDAMPLLARPDRQWVSLSQVMKAWRDANGDTGSTDWTQMVEEWREVQARKQRAKKRDARIGANGVIARRASTDPSLSGEVGLLVAGHNTPSELAITPLAEGIALRELRVEYPAPAVAVVEGSAVEPDATFENVRDADHVCALVRARADALALETVRQVERGPGTEPLRQWARRYALGTGVPEEVRSARIFPLLGGERASIAELEARGRVGYLGWGPPDLSFVAGPQPLIASDDLLGVLRKRLDLVDQIDIVDRHQVLYRGPVRVGLARGQQEGVAVLRRGVLLAVVQPRGPLPLAGAVEGDRVTPNADWSALVEDEAAAELMQSLVQKSVDLTAELLEHAGERTALLLALRRMTAEPDLLRAALRDGGSDPLLQRLVQHPLFEDSEDKTGSLADVAADRPIRAVAPEGRGRHAPWRSRCWRLDEEQRQWLSAVASVVDATSDLARETEGWKRRVRRTFTKPARPPREARPISVCGLSGMGWLANEGPGLAVVVEGAIVETMDFGVPGLQGWVEGAIRADPEFLHAELSEEQRSGLEDTVRGWLQEEARDRGSMVFADRLRRMARAHRAAGAGAPMAVPPVWHGVCPFVDPQGRPIPIEELLEDITRNGDVVVSRQLADGPFQRPVVWLRDDQESTRFASAFPRHALRRIALEDCLWVPRKAKAEDPAAKRQEQRRREIDAARKRVVEEAVALGAPRAAVDAKVARWSDNYRWVQAAADDPTGAAAVLIGWAAASKTTTEDRAGAIARIARAADRLRAVLGAPAGEGSKPESPIQGI